MGQINVDSTVERITDLTPGIKSLILQYLLNYKIDTIFLSSDVLSLYKERKKAVNRDLRDKLRDKKKTKRVKSKNKGILDSESDCWTRESVNSLNWDKIFRLTTFYRTSSGRIFISEVDEPEKVIIDTLYAIMDRPKRKKTLLTDIAISNSLEEVEFSFSKF
jgi:hypothetical protein